MIRDSNINIFCVFLLGENVAKGVLAGWHHLASFSLEASYIFNSIGFEVELLRKHAKKEKMGGGALVKYGEPCALG